MNAKEIKPLKAICPYREFTDRYLLRALVTFDFHQEQTAEALELSVTTVYRRVKSLRKQGYKIPAYAGKPRRKFVS